MHDAEDVLQDVFLKVHTNLASLQHHDRLESWIYQITRNAIHDYYRRDRRLSAPNLDEQPGLVTDDGDQAMAALATCLKPLMQTLPETYRQALELTTYQGLTQREVAEALGLSTPGAKSRVQRARRVLKEKLLECCNLEFDHRGEVTDYRPKRAACANCR